ncbi:hypothetical protein D9M68_941630 [compost metagenome]
MGSSDIDRRPSLLICDPYRAADLRTRATEIGRNLIALEIMRRPEIADACAILREGITFIDEFDDRNTIGHGSTFLLSAKTSLDWSKQNG